MAQTETGVRSALSSARLYSLVQRALGADRVRRRFVDDHVRPTPDERVLDIGCGPADILTALGPVAYVGFDPSEAYIEAARQRWGDRGRFVRADVESFDLRAEAKFAIVIAIGVLHHLDDSQAARLFARAAEALSPDGRLVTIDPALSVGQSPVARWLILRDRGQDVRDVDGYRRLAEERFGTVRPTVHSGLARFPYTHAILECERPQTASGSP